MLDKKQILPLAAAIVVVSAIASLAVVGLPARGPLFHGTTYDELLPAAEFRLVDHQGRAKTLASFRGKPVLLFFGYTHCPDVCPLTLSRLSQAVEGLGRRARDVQIVLITVDPARDTPPVLAEYVTRFGPNVVGLTGDSASVAQAMAGYGAYVLPMAVANPPMPAGHDAHGGHADHASSSSDSSSSDAPAPAQPKLGHSGVVYGIDRQGLLQVVITEGAPRDQLRDDIRTLAGL
jgi:protein SCO1